MNMLEYEEAYGIVMNSVFKTGTEVISFIVSAGRILAEDVVSDIDMPPFDRAAVDGYACHREDLYSELEVIEVIAAGKVPLKNREKNQCSKIMTGAIVPAGYDVIFMVEDSEILSSGKVRFTGKNSKSNFSLKGEDVRIGDIVLKGGKIIRPQDIAVLAAVGHTEVQVMKKPRVAVLSTGDELVEPAGSPGLSKIRNSNAYQLLSQVERAGGSAFYSGIAPDDATETLDLIQKAIDENDIVLLTGGVSMGDFDFVPSVFVKAGVKILFDKLNVQPGKPTTFGVHQKALVFGLPGNPVSSFIQFETLVRPLINRMMGYNWRPVEFVLPMAIKYERRSDSRMGWIPVLITENNEVMPVDFHGSAHITALPVSDGVITLNPGIKSVEKGEIVSVRQI